MKEIISTILKKTESELFQTRYISLNKIPSIIIDEVRALKAKPLQLFYLRNITHTDDFPFHTDFINDVIEGNEPVESWRKGTIIAPSFSIKELLQKETNILISSSIGINFEHRSVPRKERWQQNIQVGVPLIVIPDADYRFKLPDNCINYTWNTSFFEPINPNSRKIVLRRWIAQSIARMLDHFQQLNDKPDLIKLFEIVPYTDWSNDAKVALNGLMCELEYNSIGDDVPGMTGFDEWYQ